MAALCIHSEKAVHYAVYKPVSFLCVIKSVIPTVLYSFCLLLCCFHANYHIVSYQLVLAYSANNNDSSTTASHNWKAVNSDLTSLNSDIWDKWNTPLIPWFDLIQQHPIKKLERLRYWAPVEKRDTRKIDRCLYLPTPKIISLLQGGQKTDRSYKNFHHSMEEKQYFQDCKLKSVVFDVSTFVIHLLLRVCVSRWMSKTLVSKRCSPHTCSTWTRPTPATGRPKPRRASRLRSSADGRRSSGEWRTHSALRRPRPHRWRLQPINRMWQERNGKVTLTLQLSRWRRRNRWTRVCRCSSSRLKAKRSSFRLERNRSSCRFDSVFLQRNINSADRLTLILKLRTVSADEENLPEHCCAASSSCVF